MYLYNLHMQCVDDGSYGSRQKLMFYKHFMITTMIMLCCKLGVLWNMRESLLLSVLQIHVSI